MFSIQYPSTHLFPKHRCLLNLILLSSLPTYYSSVNFPSLLDFMLLINCIAVVDAKMWVGFYVLVVANKRLVVFAVLAKCSNESSYQSQNTSVKDQVYILIRS